MQVAGSGLPQMGSRLITAIDPGVSTGMVVAEFWLDKPLHILERRQFIGHPDYAELKKIGGLLVCERFVPLSNEGFSHTAETIEPVRIEAALMQHGLMPTDYTDKRWQRAACQLIVGKRGYPTRKQANDAFLREQGLWSTGKTVGQPDANDANSAMKHLVYYVKNTLVHHPTIQAYWPKTQQNPRLP